MLRDRSHLWTAIPLAVMFTLSCASETAPATGNPIVDGPDGGENDGGNGTRTCEPGQTESCYTGPEGTRHVGVCADGQRQCNAQGSAWGECDGSVLPAAAEDCATTADDDCSGAANEGCVCTPGEESDCYTAASATRDVGLCHGGRWTCKPDGVSHTPCVNEVTPAPETCSTPGDDDCNGQANEASAGCACVPNAIASCYSGPEGTAGVGSCKAGTKTCNAEGTAYGACVGEVLPTTETCNTSGDDDCDGQTNESGTGCVCVPSSTASCYTGPAGTAGIGLCKAGVRTCNPQGTAYGACVGEVGPTTESCATAGDDNCNGFINEGCP